LDEQYTELEQMSMLDDGELEPNRLQARTREECIMDMVSIWNNRALHVRASGGYKADGLLLAMDETEDGLVNGDAGEVFRLENIPELRRLAVQDMCDLFESGEAEITYEFFYSRLLEPFPKRGQLDQYREGQDDEGHDDDEGGKLYNPNDDDDAASSAASENNAEAMKAALDELRDSDIVRADGIDPEDANAVVEARNTALGAVDVMLRAAEQLHDPGVLQALETMQRKLVKASKRQTKDEIGLSMSLRSAEALKTASLKKAQTFIAKTRKIQKNSELAQKEAALALDVLKKRKQEMRDEEASRLRAKENAETRKHFTAEMLGYGKENGGGGKEREARKDLFLRLSHKFTLSPIVRNDLDLFFERWDKEERIRHGHEGKGYGLYFQKFADALLKNHEAGEAAAFENFIVEKIRAYKLFAVNAVAV
jgi:hypothetical protein